MIFTLYVQRRRGKQIAKPVAIKGVTLDSDNDGRTVYAFQKDGLLTSLEFTKVIFSKDGVRFVGFEEIHATPASTFYLQEWWCAWESSP